MKRLTNERSNDRFLIDLLWLMFALFEWKAFGILLLLCFHCFGFQLLRRKYLLRASARMAEKISYGPMSDQFFFLHKPAEATFASPVMILIHGGYWKQYYHLNNALCDKLVGFFQQQGYFVCQLEYRRGNREVDGGQGGWPETNQDIVLSFNKLYDLTKKEGRTEYYQKIDLNQSIVIGHSAGGTLALWSSTSQTNQVIEEYLPGIEPFKFFPTVCVAIAPVGGLLDGYRERLSDGGDAVETYLKTLPTFKKGSNDQELSLDSPYRLASPDMLLPMRTNTLIVAGDEDDIVPLHLIRSFAAKASQSYQTNTISGTSERRIQQPKLIVLPGADHFKIVDPNTSAWAAIYQEILAQLNS